MITIDIRLFLPSLLMLLVGCSHSSVVIQITNEMQKKEERRIFSTHISCFIAEKNEKYTNVMPIAPNVAQFFLFLLLLKHYSFLKKNCKRKIVDLDGI
jgi:hypothetical protein